jgi:hypothetical protein
VRISGSPTEVASKRRMLSDGGSVADFSPTSVHERPNTTENRGTPETREQDESTRLEKLTNSAKSPSPVQIRAAPPNFISSNFHVRVFVVSAMAALGPPSGPYSSGRASARFSGCGGRAREVARSRFRTGSVYDRMARLGAVLSLGSGNGWRRIDERCGKILHRIPEREAPSMSRDRPPDGPTVCRGAVVEG